MPKHEDNDPVMFRYSASCNITFRGDEESVYTWEEWRALSWREKDEAISMFVFDNLGVEVSVIDDE